MASANEIIGSGEGDAWGNMDTAATRTFQVFLDAAGDDPIDALLAVNTDVWMAMVHPTPRFNGLFVAGYGKAAQEDLKLWLVDVYYRSPYVISPTQWTLYVEHAVQTEQMARDLLGKLVGPRGYRLPHQVYPLPPDEPGPTPPLEDATHFATALNTPKTELVRVVDDDGKAIVTRQPIDRYAPISRLVLRRTVPVMTDRHWQMADDLHVTMNTYTFYGAPQGHILFMGMRAAQSSKFSGESTGLPAQWDVELSFLRSRRIWSPQRMLDSYRSPEVDQESFVYPVDADAEEFTREQDQALARRERLLFGRSKLVIDGEELSPRAAYQDFYKYRYGDINRLVYELGPR